MKANRPDEASRPPATPGLRAALLTSVGGSVLQRLSDAFQPKFGEMRVSAYFTAEEWRGQMNEGRLGRLRARLGSYLVFPLRSVLQALEGPRDQVLVVSTNPFFLPTLMTGTRFLHGKRVVALVYDLFPEAAIAAGVVKENDLISRAVRLANGYYLRHADAVVFIGRHMARQVTERYGAPKRSCVIETGAVAAEFSTPSATSFGSDSLREFCGGKVVISYVGNLGHVHDWETLCEGLSALLSRDNRAVAVIAASGPGLEALKVALGGIPKDRLRFEPPLSDQDWAWLMWRTDIALVTLKDSAKHTSIPSKVFSAMAARCAVVAVAPEGSDLAELCEEYGCGLTVRPGRGGEMVRILEELVGRESALEAAKRKSNDALISHFEMSVLAEKWAKLLLALDGAGEYPLKRPLDVALSASVLVLLSPLVAATAVAVKCFLGSPILFRQHRTGRHGVPFEIIKFRSMRPSLGDVEEGTTSDAARLTEFGRFIRSLSLDELPTLVNVLKGEMSLVGPRPLVTKLLTKYSPDQMGRHEATPGITGWAQVNGRNAIDWEKKFKLDLYYVENQSLALDLRILLKTVVKVLARTGVSSEGHATTPEFDGNDPSRSAAGL